MKKHAWIFYFLVGLVATAEICWLYKDEKEVGKEEKETLLKPADMQKDITYFFSTLKTIHPNLYVKYDSLTFVALEKKMKEACSSAQSPLAFECILLKAQRFLDGHTGFLVKELYKSLRKERLPEIYFQPDGMWLGKDTLLRIGNVACMEFCSTLDSMVSWEYNAKKRNLVKNDLLNFLLYNC